MKENDEVCCSSKSQLSDYLQTVSEELCRQYDVCINIEIIISNIDNISSDFSDEEVERLQLIDTHSQIIQDVSRLIRNMAALLPEGIEVCERDLLNGLKLQSLQDRLQNIELDVDRSAELF